ncbi:MAG TPA: hypothetical protein VFB82_13245, partial [Blastocatellia bacterium]|nr:hypothetical protein [Blastocatellia bacterium]
MKNSVRLSNSQVPVRTAMRFSGATSGVYDDRGQDRLSQVESHDQKVRGTVEVTIQGTHRPATARRL